MVVVRGQRRGPILTPSSLPCLGNLPTINVTDGCIHGCLYCYTQGYSCYPGSGRVVVFDDIPCLVRSELSRKRHKPTRVYFSPSSDAFQPVQEVQNVTYETMSVLLAAGVEVAFLTKGAIEERFLSLFSRFPKKIFAQIGITTIDERLQNVLEPGAASPRQRLQAIEDLARLGIPVSARLDPLIPEVTDIKENLAALLAELGNRHIQSIAASYVFTRPAFARHFSAKLRQFLGEANSPALSWHPLADGLGGGQMMRAEERRERFVRLGALAVKYGIDLHVCACKNPDLSLKSECKIAGPATHHIRDALLFE